MMDMKCPRKETIALLVPDEKVGHKSERSAHLPPPMVTLFKAIGFHF